MRQCILFIGLIFLSTNLLAATNTQQLMARIARYYEQTNADIASYETRKKSYSNASRGLL